MSDFEPLKLGFLASHSGSSLRAIVTAIEAGELNAEAVVVISNNADAPALAFAREHGVSALHISATTEGGAEAADQAILEAMEAADAELILLSGYLRKIGPETLAVYEGRVMNIHPALLPRHGGQGMFGRKVHEAVLAAGDPVSGATVHLVDAEYDHGPPLLQGEVEVEPGETVDSLQAKVMALEPHLYIEVLKTIIEGRARV